MDLLDNLKIGDLKIIGQSADKSVIFCYHTKKRRILGFDQHAVDERIRFERILDGLDHVDDLDLVKSRACHGAVRVGDKLTLRKCYNMIGKLLKCKVPYKCAHSRCSVCVLDNLDKIIYLDKVDKGFIQPSSELINS